MADDEDMRASLANGRKDETSGKLLAAGADPRICASSRSWPGITANCFEMHGPGRHLRSLRSHQARLVVILEAAGCICEVRLSPTGEGRSRRNDFNLVSTIPAGVDAWLCADGIKYLRFVTVGFDFDRLAPHIDYRRTFAMNIMVTDPLLFQYAKLIADQCEWPDRPDAPDQEILGLAALLASVSVSQRVENRQPLTGLAPWQLRRVMDYVEENLTDTIRLKTLAEICRLSPSHFGRAFRCSTGVPPHRWVMNMRVKHARDLLADGAASLAEIASMSGFADQSHFTRVFANTTGRCPGAWRREVRARRSRIA
jgi:AraC family transcriptional regulator